MILNDSVTVLCKQTKILNNKLNEKIHRIIHTELDARRRSFFFIELCVPLEIFSSICAMRFFLLWIVKNGWHSIVRNGIVFCTAEPFFLSIHISNNAFHSDFNGAANSGSSREQQQQSTAILIRRIDDDFVHVKKYFIQPSDFFEHNFRLQAYLFLISKRFTTIKRKKKP